MKTILVLWCLCLSAAAGVVAQEAINLTVPVVPPTPPTLSGYGPGAITIQVSPKPYIQVVLVGSDGQLAFFTYPCAAPCAMDTEAKVLTMITGLNTANLSTRSLWRRVMDRLVLDFPERFTGGAVVQ